MSDRHGNRVQEYEFGSPWHREANPTGFRAYVLLGRYKPKAQISHETNVFGRVFWFAEIQHRIFAATLAELDAGHDLHTGVIAKMTGASQGYVTKTLQRLTLWRFIAVERVIRGRWGRIIAHLVQRVRQSFHHREGLSVRRNDYQLLDPRYTDPFGSWNRSLARLGLSDA